MADCVCLPTCIFFNDKMAEMPATAELLKKRFCRDGGDECARYMVFAALGRDRVPIDLYPTQTQRAEHILTLAG